MAAISHGADWDFDLLERYDAAISDVATEYGLDTYPNQLEIITAEDAEAAEARGEDVVTLAMVGDGGTSEGDFHEALNFAAVFQLPVVFFVQNNKYAISVPFAKQSAAPSLAHKAVGYGLAGERVDGNDLRAVAAALEAARALEEARPRVIIFDTRMGKGVPFLEARERNHFLKVETDEWALALNAIEAGRTA